jgi:hypothetical protein
MCIYHFKLVSTKKKVRGGVKVRPLVGKEMGTVLGNHTSTIHQPSASKQRNWETVAINHEDVVFGKI